VFEIEDDGRVIDVDSIRRTALKRRVRSEEELAQMSAVEIRELIFAPGFSTRAVVTDVSGRGVGLDVVRAKTDLLKGTLSVESEAGSGCRMRLYLPLTLATSRVLIVAASGRSFALPLEHVETARLVAAREIFPIKGCDAILTDGAPLTVIPLGTLLGLAAAPREVRQAAGSAAGDRTSPCIILAVGKDRLGVLVDSLIDEQEIVVKQFGALLKRVPNVAGAAILGSGEVCIVLNAADLLKTARKRLSHSTTAALPQEAPRAPVILLVEDSLTTRTQEKRILEGAGYEVVTAVDGMDGYSKLRSREFDAVVSDVEMPNMDGLTLTARIREDPAYGELPIILVTSLGSDESRRKGLDVGASAYLAKSTFDQAVLLETLRRLL
jgi:two-component system chemotaxis sensor kinase CheA